MKTDNLKSGAVPMGKLLDSLTDTGDLDAVDGDTPDPAELERMAKTAATMLWTLRLIQRSSGNCWVKRKIRKYTLALMFVLGALATAQAASVYMIRIAMYAADARVQQISEQTVRRIIDEYGLKPHHSALETAPTTIATNTGGNQ